MDINFVKSFLGLWNRKETLRKRRIRTLQGIGDSIATYQEIRGLQFGAATNINTSGLAVQGYAASLKTAAGNGTLRYVASTHTIYWTAPGDTEGAGVNIATDGLYDLPSGTATLTYRIGVTARLLPVANQTDTIASGTRYWRISSGSVMGIVHAFTNRRFTLLPHLGIGGQYSSDINNRYSQALTTSADGVIIEISGGTNDICADSQTAATVVTRRTTKWPVAAAQGIPVIALGITPRFGAVKAGGGAGGDTAYSAAKQAYIMAANRGMYAITQTSGYESIYYCDVCTNLIDPTAANGYIRDYATEDGLHPSGDMAYEMAVPIVRQLDNLSPDTRSATNVGAGSYYDATYNPGGNLIGSNLGAFASTAGTVNGTGAGATATYATSTSYAQDAFAIYGSNLYRNVGATGTSGTVTPPVHTSGVVVDGGVSWQFVSSGVTAGLGTGWTTARLTGSAVQVRAHKLAATDGGPDWQEFIIYGATANEASATAEVITFYPTAISGGALSKFATDDLIDTSIQVQIPDGVNACYGFYFENIYAGGLTVTHDNLCLKNCYRGIRRTEPFTLGLLPIPYAVSTSNIQPKFYISSKMGAVFRVRVRNFDMHKVL